MLAEKILQQKSPKIVFPLEYKMCNSIVLIKPHDDIEEENTQVLL
jgi:hypothetical protein